MYFLSGDMKNVGLWLNEAWSAGVGGAPSSGLSPSRPVPITVLMIPFLSTLRNA